MEVETCDGMRHAEPAVEDAGDEILGAVLREGLAERLFDNCVEAHQVEKTRLHRRRGQAEHRVGGAEDGARMRLEGQRERRTAVPARLVERLLQNRPVAAMHAVEIADGDDTAAQIRRQMAMIPEADEGAAGHLRTGMV